MKFSTILAGALLTAASSALPWSGHGNRSPHRTVYFLRVDPSGSNIVAIRVGRNGALRKLTSVTSTGGMGLQSINATSGDPVAIDPLQGQHSVVIGDTYLFTINSGSDTAAMFSIDPQDPLKLTMVGSPMPTLGEFAMSIAYSSKYQKACVLNGGAMNGVACYDVDSEKGLMPDGVGLRNFGYAGTTPAQLMGAKGSGSDIQFSADSSKLVVTFKGNTKPKMTLGHIDVFDVDSSGNVAKTWTDNQVSPSGQTFGFALNGFDMSQYYVSDAAFGGILVDIDSESNKATNLATVNNTAFGASCWAVWSPQTGYFYDINAATPNLGVVTQGGTLKTVYDYDSKLVSAVDSIVDSTEGTTLYMMNGINAISRMDLKTGKVLQTFEYATMDDRPFWTGMAMWPADPMLSGNMG